MQIKLSDHFGYKTLIKFTLPSILMMIFASVYGVVDGFFISRYVGKTSFSAVNFIFPVIMIVTSVGFMIGAGGSALVAKTLGQGEKEKANRIFSMLVYLSIVLSLILAALGILFLRPIAKAIGAEGQMLEDCLLYGKVLLAALPFGVLQLEFQSFLITAERPNLGLISTVGAGVANMLLDALLVAVLPFGLLGAALASAISQVIGAVIPLFFFALNKTSLLRLTKTGFYGKAFLKTCSNGSSELMSNIAMSLVSILYNAQLYRFAKEDGVSAYGVLMYVGMIFNAIFIGYSVGTASVVGYHYGAENKTELKSLLKKSLIIIGVSSICMTLLSQALTVPLSKIFVGYDQALFLLTCRAFRFFSFAFLFMGFAIYASSFFTALNNGLLSALISFLRTLVFQTGAVLILPKFFALDGVWASLVVAEFTAALISFLFLYATKKRYF